MLTKLAPILVGAALVASCSRTSVPTGPTASAPTTAAPPAPATTAPSSSPVAHRPPAKVLVIVEENHGTSSALSSMPTLAQLAHQYGYATNYLALTHPSLPNYLALAGGSTFGVTDDAGPSTHPIPGQSVFDQALALGRSARTYAESMDGPCQLTSHGDYAVRHNPWTYFSDARSRSGCDRYDLPAGSTASGSLNSDVRAGRLPDIGFLVPNLCHDAHDCSLGTADSWLRDWLSVLRSGPDWTSGRLAIVVTFDENEGGSPNTVLTAVLSPGLQQVVTTAPLSHYSLVRFLDETIGAPELRGAAGAASLAAAFGL